MPTGTWVITSARGGNSGSSALRNCSIVGTPTGYDFKSPQPNSQVLASSTSLSLPVTFNFRGGMWGGGDWTVTVEQFTPRASGTWENNYASPESQTGTWEGGVGGEGEEGDAEGEHSAD